MSDIQHKSRHVKAVYVFVNVLVCFKVSFKRNAFKKVK